MKTYVGNAPPSSAYTLGQMPIGGIIQWGNAKIPAGWLECNGQSTAQFPELADLYGANLPDMRGQFVRGFDNGAGVDTGRVLGSSQADSLEDHDHLQTVGTDNGFVYHETTATGTPVYGSVIQGSFRLLQTTPAVEALAPRVGYTSPVKRSLGGETRPKNIALIFIVKAYYAGTTPVLGMLPANKNYIINGDFKINQRGYAGAVVGADTYGFDRWLVSNGYSMSVPDANGFSTVGGSASAPAVSHRLEEFGFTGTVTMSWEGTAKVGEYRDAGEAWDIAHTSPYTFNLQSGTLFGSKALIGFSDGTMKNVKLEIGSVATPFEVPDITSEQLKCQRYYCSGEWSMRYSGGATNDRLQGMVYFPVYMRVAPSVVVTPVTGSTPVLNIIRESTVSISMLSPSAGATVQATYTADAEL